MSDQQQIRDAKMQSLMRSADKAESYAKELEGLINLPQDGDNLEATFDAADASEIETDFEGKKRKVMSFPFKDNTGKARSIRLAPKWGKPMISILMKHHGVAKIKITRLGQGKEETQYIIEDKTAAE